MNAISTYVQGATIVVTKDPDDIHVNLLIRDRDGLAVEVSLDPDAVEEVREALNEVA